MPMTMDTTTEQLLTRLRILLQQTDRDRAELQSPALQQGRELHDRLFDSLHATLHNLQGQKAVESDRGD